MASFYRSSAGFRKEFWGVAGEPVAKRLNRPLSRKLEAHLYMIDEVRQQTRLRVNTSRRGIPITMPDRMREQTFYSTSRNHVWHFLALSLLFQGLFLAALCSQINRATRVSDDFHHQTTNRSVGLTGTEAPLFLCHCRRGSPRKQPTFAI